MSMGTLDPTSDEHFNEQVEFLINIVVEKMKTKGNVSHKILNHSVADHDKQQYIDIYARWILEKEIPLEQALSKPHYLENTDQVSNSFEQNLVINEDDNSVHKLHRDYHHFNSTWRDSDKKIFVQQFVEHPKHFSKIASAIPFKTASDCVLYYYLKKKPLNLRQKVYAKQSSFSVNRMGTILHSTHDKEDS